MKKTVRVATLVIVIICLFAGLASAGTVMDRILKNNKLVVGITGTQPPLNVTTKDGKIIGFDADMANAISANLGVELKLSKMPFSQLLTALQNGKV
ncbi:MAG: transporter substrate-binding domain-containing protein, partial [Desulfobacterales bacterium]